VEEHLGLELVVGDGQGHDGEVERAGLELGEQRGGGGIDDDDPELRVGFLRGLQQLGGEPSGGGADDADAGRAGDDVAHRGDVGDHGVELGVDPPHPLDHGQALLGEGAGGAVDQQDAQLLLEAGDVGRDVGLHRVQGARRGGEPAVVGDGDEGVELSEVHLGWRWYPSGETVGQICARDCLL
jgi:hypothetical protein